MPGYEQGCGGHTRCTMLAREHREEPGGSAFLADLTLLVEVTLPWADQPWRAPHVPESLRSALSEAAARRPAVQCYAIAPDKVYSVPGYSRVIAFRRPHGLASRFEKAEYLVPTDLAGRAVSLLAAGDASTIAELQSYQVHTEHIRELLVCTHGSVDACCGMLGYPFFEAARRISCSYTDQPVRVWRVSHIGGHRFAPTMVDFPSGHMWAYLDEQVLHAILQRGGHPNDLMPYYRGWGGLKGYYLQLTEQEILRREGWDWLDYRKQGVVLEGVQEGYPVLADQPQQRAVVRIDFESPDGMRHGSYIAHVEHCGETRTAVSCKLSALRDAYRYRVAELALLQPDEALSEQALLVTARG